MLMMMKQCKLNNIYIICMQVNVCLCVCMYDQANRGNELLSPQCRVEVACGGVCCAAPLPPSVSMLITS